MRNTAIMGHTATLRSHHSQRTSPAILSGTSSRALFRPASAWCATFIPERTWLRPTSATRGGTTKSTATRCIPPSNAIPVAEEQTADPERNPERTAIRGLWSDVDFLEQTGTPEFNKNLKHTQFADFHSHGWIFRAVYKHDRKGQLLDAEGK